MEEPNSIIDLAKIGGATGIGGLIAALFIKFTFRKYTEEDAAQQRAGGETDIIEQLRKEVDRLANLNEILSRKLGEQQSQIIALSTENTQLKTAIDTLSQQINALKSNK